MVRSGHDTVRGTSAIQIAWLVLAVLLSAALPASGQDCSDYGGVLDGFAGDIAPSQLQIDMNCTIRNYPASNPLNTNFSFFTQPGQTDVRYLVVFDNVVHTGNMSCNATHEHKIWFTNGSSSKIKQQCQNLLIPVEKIDKRNPAGQTTAAIGVPFTYTLTIPVLFDPATGTVINNAGSVNDLHSILITDNLNETGADLSYVSHTAYYLGSGAPVSHSFSNAGGLLTFDVEPVILAGEQIVIELTVVLDATPANVPGSQFVNTAKWQFGRLIDGTFFEPLPGEWGITEPMTIAAPELVMTKTGPRHPGPLAQPGRGRRLPPGRPEHGSERRLERDSARSPSGRTHRRHVRPHSHGDQRPGLRGRRHHAGLGAPGPGCRLQLRLRRRPHLRADAGDAHGSRCHRRGPAPDRRLPDEARSRQPGRRRADQRRRRHRVVQRRPDQPGPRRLQPHPQRRHPRGRRPRGCAHGHGGPVPATSSRSRWRT